MAAVEAPLVHLLVNVGFDGPLQALVRRWDGLVGRLVRIASYQSLMVRRHVPAGTYVFSDIDRIPSADYGGVVDLWDTLRVSGAAHLVNDPRQVRLRYALLRRLYEQGVNDFNVYRADENLDAVRYPVFVRCEHDHGGPRTPLLENRAALTAALQRLSRRRAWRGQLIVTECVVDPDADGLFRKYGALVANDEVIPWHVIASRSWFVKGSTRESTDRLREEQRRYTADNPHAARIRDAFRAANIEYGRIDYAISGGRMRVFEINTNPALGGSGRPTRRTGRRSSSDPALVTLVDAFAALARRCPHPGRMIPITPRHGVLSGWAYRSLRQGQSLVARYAHRPGIR